MLFRGTKTPHRAKKCEQQHTVHSAKQCYCDLANKIFDYDVYYIHARIYFLVVSMCACALWSDNNVELMTFIKRYKFCSSAREGKQKLDRAEIKVSQIKYNKDLNEILWRQKQKPQKREPPIYREYNMIHRVLLFPQFHKKNIMINTRTYRY